MNIGPYVLNADRGELSLGSDKTTLSPKATDVLVCLASTPGEVVSRETIHEQVWTGKVVTDTQISKAILELRSAFDDTEEPRQVIETLPRRGYRLLLPIGSARDPQSNLNSKEDANRIFGGKPWRNALITVIALAAISIGGWIVLTNNSAVGSRSFSTTNSSSHIEHLPIAGPRSIAVLPFADLSPKGDQGYLGDGISEELIDGLVRLEGLLVSGRTSSFSFRRTNATHAEIAKELGVGTILEGSVRKDQNKVRITANLINTVDGYHLWSQSYDRELADVFAIQEEIATSVAGVLGVKLGVGSINAFKGAGTRSIEAYEAYLQGLALEFNEVDKAMRLFERATKLDPNYAAAWAQWGIKTLSTSWNSHPEEAPKIVERAFPLVQRAVDLDPTSAQSLSLLGNILSAKQDWIGSESAHLRALMLLSDRLHHAVYGFSLMRNGRSAAALAQWDEAESVESLSGKPISFRMHVAIAQGRFADARESLSQSNENQANGGRLIIALNEGKAEEIEAALTSLPPSTVSKIALYAPVLEMFDSPKNVLSILQATYEDSSSKWPSKLHDIALLAAYFGEPELALQVIADELRNSPVRLQAVWYPVMSEVRKLPQFKALVTDLNLVDYWRAVGWADLCRPLGEDDFECF